MTGFAPDWDETKASLGRLDRQRIMDQLKEDLRAWQGLQCAMPSCVNEWTDAAHIQGSGSGGRISTYTIENMVGLCRSCHDTFDGRDLAGRQHMLRELMFVHVSAMREAKAKDRMRTDRRLAGF